MTPAEIVVIKVGSSSITTASGELSDQALGALVAEIVACQRGGARPVLVTSGAISAGQAAMRLARADLSMVDLQGLAAIGQGLLMARYTELFAARGLQAGQILFTGHDFGERIAYLNSRRTLRRLLDWGVVPIVNENDTTATDEISLGENDRLAALVATLIGADLLVILTDTAGIYSADPRLHAEASLIEEVAGIDSAIEAAAAGPGSTMGTGGMATKVAAAKLASWSGIPCVIAAASEPGVVVRAIAGDPVGTRIRARARRLPARKCWIAFARRSSGRVTIDAGAAEALRRGGSLLPVGIESVTGRFAPRDAIEIMDEAGTVIAKGLTTYPSRLLAEVAGRRGADLPAGLPGEAVHRDDLVLLGGQP